MNWGKTQFIVNILYNGIIILLLFIGSTLARDGGISLAEGCELLKGQLQLNGLRGTVHHFDDIIHFNVT